jgi:hypothetical protein
MSRLLSRTVVAAVFLGAMTAAAFADPGPVADGSTAAPAAGAQNSATASAVTVADPNKVVCRREQVTGSNMFDHICKTKAEWARLAEEHQRETDDYKRQHQISGCPNRAC